jgi:hypothetical protein
VFRFSPAKKKSAQRKGLALRDTFCGNFASKSLKLQSQLHIYSELIYKSEVAGDCQFNLSAKYGARRTSSGGFIIPQWQESFIPRRQPRIDQLPRHFLNILTPEQHREICIIARN